MRTRAELRPRQRSEIQRAERRVSRGPGRPPRRRGTARKSDRRAAARRRRRDPAGRSEMPAGRRHCDEQGPADDRPHTFTLSSGPSAVETLRGGGSRLTWAHNGGRYGRVSVERLHRRLFFPETPPSARFTAPAGTRNSIAVPSPRPGRRHCTPGGLTGAGCLVDEVEEQLERRYDALRAGARETASSSPRSYAALIRGRRPRAPARCA